MVGNAAHQFNELSAIAYDEAEDTIYFNVRDDLNASIFSLRLFDNSTQTNVVRHVVAKSQGELVHGIAFDPLDRVLYWTDSRNNNIMRAHVGRTSPGDSTAISSATIWLNGTAKPLGIAVDACRRRLYWTTATGSPTGSATVHRASLDGAKSEMIVSDERMYMPLGIVVDQYSKRLYWVDDLRGNHFAVESSGLDGTERRNLVKEMHHTPQNIAVDRDTVYWTDSSPQHGIWKTDKITANGGVIMVANLTTSPSGIIVRNHLLSSQASNEDCSATIQGMRQQMKLVGTSTAPPTTALDVETLPVHNFCLNNGELNTRTSTCICPAAYRGHFCEVHVCNNYCLQGKCVVATTGYAQCTCDSGYSGDRCQNNVCTAYCLNAGTCSVMEDGVAACKCGASFSGQRCDRVDHVEVCRRYCEDAEELDGFDMHSMCGK